VLHNRKIEEINWIPQATLDIPIDFFRSQRGIKFHEGTDDLDRFEGTDLMKTKGTVFILRHYSGYPPGSVTIYLPIELSDLKEIKHSLDAILSKLQIPSSKLLWWRGGTSAQPVRF
jgi:hypothetical protein